MRNVRTSLVFAVFAVCLLGAVSCGEGSASTDGVNIAASDNVCVMVGNSGNCTSTTRATGAGGGGGQTGGEEGEDAGAETADGESAPPPEAEALGEPDEEFELFDNFYDPVELEDGVVSRNLPTDEIHNLVEQLREASCTCEL